MFALFCFNVMMVIPTIFFVFLDIPLRQVIAEECVAFMLNWRENEYLTLQVPAFLLQSNPYVKVICV